MKTLKVFFWNLKRLPFYVKTSCIKGLVNHRSNGKGFHIVSLQVFGGSYGIQWWWV